MRPASFGIVFAMVFLSFLTMSDYRTASLQETALQKLMYNNCLDSAIEDAMAETVEVDEGRQIRLNKQKAVEDFFTALSVSFAAMENPEKKELLKAYVPAIAFVERNKVTFYYDFLEGEKSEEVFFQMERGDYRIYFTLMDYVYVENRDTGEQLEGDFHDVGKVFAEPLLLDEGWFHEEQNKAIRAAFLEQLEEIIEGHNEAARKLGIKYRFFLPLIEGEDWYRGIEQISMLVFFQGYPYGNKIAGYYNRMAIGGAEIRKEERQEVYFKYEETGD